MNPRGSGVRRIACSLLALSLLLIPVRVVRSQSGPLFGPSDGAQSEASPGLSQEHAQEAPPEPPQPQSSAGAPPEQSPDAPAPSLDAGMPPVAAPAPTGLCALKVSTDRSTMHLMDPASGTERKHVSLGRDRMQRAFTSPDGAWTVVLYKVRGVPQYGIIAIDLANCEPQDFVNVPAAAEAARFSTDEVTLTFPGGKERKVGLRNKALP